MGVKARSLGQDPDLPAALHAAVCPIPFGYITTVLSTCHQRISTRASRVADFFLKETVDDSADAADLRLSRLRRDGCSVNNRHLPLPYGYAAPQHRPIGARRDQGPTALLDEL
jgi:hypothetical protein